MYYSAGGYVGCWKYSDPNRHGPYPYGAYVEKTYMIIPVDLGFSKVIGNARMKRVENLEAILVFVP